MIRSINTVLVAVLMSPATRATFPATRTAATHAFVVVNMSNEAVSGASVDGEGADDVDCNDDASE